MFHQSLDHSQTIEAGVVMSANQATDNDNAFSLLRDIVSNKGANEQLIIICEDKLCRNMTLSLLAKGIKSTTFLSELCDEKETFASQKLEFNRSKIAVCSDEAYQKLDLPLSDMYVIFGMPPKLSRFPKLLKSIEKSAESANRMVHVDVIVKPTDGPELVKSLYTQMKDRISAVPSWLKKAIVMHYAEEDLQVAYLNNESRPKRPSTPSKPAEKALNNDIQEPLTSSDTSGSPGSSFLQCQSIPSSPPIELIRKNNEIKPKNNEVEEDFDIYNMRPNAEGRYLIPARFIVNADYDENEVLSSSDITYDDEYDYESALYDEDFEYEY
ncbi:hypothetical protein CRE_18223 [Caenorhabditis remanei]|uniref:Uncharacterized protein n=1 Tax=Caenorhabditis remanei TaxID=31234 RepID=E3NCK1_CAERE|nr:hypothetical protein CRE_18223 [Caenorhabditis remanei]